jgi:hypothetical protein
MAASLLGVTAENAMHPARPSGTPHVITAVAALVGLLAVLNVTISADGEARDAFIQRVVSEITRGPITVHAVRHLQAGTLSGKHRGWMEVETFVNPDGVFSWSVIDAGGSERTRDKVFKAFLEAEADAVRGGARDAAALSPDNYEFIPLGIVNGQQRIHLKPRRQDSRLIQGTLTVSAEGYPIVLEGKLAKSPSFWVRSVTIVKRFDRVGGVSLPVSLESLADVRFVGKSSFSMRYDYTVVNGHPVGHTRAVRQMRAIRTSFDPSPRILALHAQLHQGR